jgi:hypothetical protein
MQLLKQMLPSAALAAVVTAVLLFTLRANGKARVAAGAFAVGAGSIAGHVLAAGWPSFPPRAATHWLFWFVVMGVIAAVVDALVRSKRTVRFVIWAIVGTTACRLILEPKFKYAWSALEGWLWVFVIALGIVALICCLNLVERGPVGPATLFSVTTILSAGTCVALMLSGSLLLGELAGVLAAVAATSFLLIIAMPAAFHPRGAAIPLSLMHAGLWLSGFFYAELPAASAVLLAVAPGLALLPVGGKSQSRWLELACRAGFVAIPVVGAVALAFHASPPLED